MPRPSSNRTSSVSPGAIFRSFRPTRAIPRWNMRSISISRVIPLKRVVASFAGVKQLYRYYSHIYTILSYPWLIRKEFPKAQIMIGGGAFTAFADQLIEKLPEGTIGLLGEGEDAILKVIEGQSHRRRALHHQRRKDSQEGPAGLTGAARCPDRRSALPDLDFPAISRISSVNRSACSRSGAAPMTAPSVSIPILKANGSGIGRPRWS